MQWQSVLGRHLSLNFWLKEEQPVAFYLSGVSSVLENAQYILTLPPVLENGQQSGNIETSLCFCQCIQALDTDKPKILFSNNIAKFIQNTDDCWYSEEWTKQQEWAGAIVTA